MYTQNHLMNKESAGLRLDTHRLAEKVLGMNGAFGERAKIK